MCDDGTDSLHIDDLAVARAVGLAFDTGLSAAPPRMTEFAIGAFRRRATAGLAIVTHDSIVGEDHRGRGATDPRLVRFSSADRQLTVRIDADDVTLTVDPPGPGWVVVETTTSSHRRVMDTNGTVVTRIDTLPMRIRVEHGDDPFVTPWIVG